MKSAAELLEGTVVGNFLIEQMEQEEDDGGTLFAAKQLSTNNIVAMKLLPKGTSERHVASRFARAGRVRSPHVPAVVDLGSLPNGQPYVVSEHVVGRSLRDVLQGEVLPVPTAVHLALEVCDALSAAEAEGLVHRRLTTGCLVLSTTPNGVPIVKVMNLTGVASSVAEGRGEAEAIPYVAPELFQPNAEPTKASNIWAFGVILYELLTGTLPFGTGARSKMAKRVTQPPAKRPRELRREISEPLEHAILRCLERDPAARWAAMLELAEVLAPWAAGMPAALGERLAKRRAGAGSDGARVSRSKPPSAAPPAMAAVGGMGGSIAGPVFDDAVPEDAIGFRRRTKDGRIEDLAAADVAGIARAKRVAAAAAALAREGPKVAPPPEEATGARPITELGGSSGTHEPLPVIEAHGLNSRAPVSQRPQTATPAPVRDGRSTVVVLVLAVAIIMGLLFGLILKLALT